MSGREHAKRAKQDLADRKRPRGDETFVLALPPRAETVRLRDDGVTPNHPSWPLILYRAAVLSSNAFDPAAVLENLFRSNGWGGTWRDGIYGFTHYHAQTHEALGVAGGSAKVQFGGEKGPILEVQAGDVAILPAGTGHKRVEASKDFLVVGAYPPEGKYDECTKPQDRERALATIAQTPRPASDPVYGPDGPLMNAWT